MCNWLCQWYAADGPTSAAEIADDFLDLLLRGLLRNDGAAPDQAGRQNAIDKAEYHARAIRFHSERLEQLLPSLASPPGGAAVR